MQDIFIAKFGNLEQKNEVVIEQNKILTHSNTFNDQAIEGGVKTPQT